MGELIQQNVSLQEYTTFKIGGNAQYFAEPANLSEIKEVLAFAAEHGLSVRILGGGANTLVSDEGCKGLVLRTSQLNHIRAEGEHIIAECGLSVDQLCDFAAEQGLSGTEFAAGLPGSIGGAVYMNARCYGSEFADIVESVRYMRLDQNTVQTLQHDEIGYAYKHSCFMEMSDILILDVTFRLHKGDIAAIRAQSQANRDDRQSKGQYDYPSAGCIFKNNYEIGIPAGKLIENAGLKGVNVGGAKVYNRHANFIVNEGNATAADVRQLIRKIQQTLDGQGYHLEPEVRILDSEGREC